ncbi:hypothetical protein [Acinetobacter sp. SWAC57]|uniref:hypothetical protein n=1 Tax=Acinetobacter sp. SWAC57 TaxID=2293834 RepID=UPI000E5A407B|nr:hypothetical protein [Acinetobacter sp. SWAC57]RGD93488.1 hypothetical protein DYI96_01245 [Acinetobacter sp. SWAC57]
MIIYQMLMMLWEAILENGLLVAILLTLLIVPWLYWLIKNRQKKFNHRRSTWIAFSIAILGFFFLPLYFSATLFDLSYWVDWAFHLAMVIALLFYSYLVCLPFTVKNKTI